MKVSPIAFCLTVVLTGSIFAEENWPQFRGPTGRGHSESADVPEKWGPENVKWRKELKGTGQSSPVNWGDKLFLTSSSDDGTERYVFCLDRKTGDLIWDKTIPCAKPESAHKMNSRATPSCATDGERVVAFFGPAGIHCYDLAGNEVWSKNLGDFPGGWGIAASPIIVGDVVIQNCDATGPSRLVALDKGTGDIVWETKREDKPRGGWSTPVLIEFKGKKELVLNGEFGVRGYDPATGEELWFCKGFNGRGAPMPDYA
ncbi:MAG: PQQ-binding-like beta-propeller repeat protein, partial [Verrucomicrobiales bacterium]|nr:PQQ-binding-like beta-propeller repeat protein [Verrucomicrobiales bacterium]